MTTIRPWGHYEVLTERPDFKVKRIVVRPGQRLSSQRHRLRFEHWYLLEGRALAEIENTQSPLEPGQSVDIPAGAWHRLANIGDDDLVLIEIQRGSYFGEDDIERRDDDYGRVGL